jgi:hypothetical protein
MKSMQEKRRKGPLLSRPDHDIRLSLFPEKQFHAVVDFEKARSARSGKPCLLMLLGIAGFGAEKDGFVKELTRTLFSVTREIDLKGWWRTDSQIGILFTGVDALSPPALDQAQTLIKHKILAALRAKIGDRVTERIYLSWSLLPESFLATHEA